MIWQCITGEFCIILTMYYWSILHYSSFSDFILRLQHFVYWFKIDQLFVTSIWYFPTHMKTILYIIINFFQNPTGRIHEVDHWHHILWEAPGHRRLLFLTFTWIHKNIPIYLMCISTYWRNKMLQSVIFDWPRFETEEMYSICYCIITCVRWQLSVLCG